MKALRSAFVCVLFAAAAGPLHAQQRDTMRVTDPPLLPAMAGGVVGSAAGAVGVARLAFAIADCESRDVCEGVATTLGAGIGGILGATLGANFGAQLTGASPSFRRTLLVSAAGSLVGLGAAVLVSTVHEGIGVAVAYSVGQGMIAGLGASLWQRR